MTDEIKRPNFDHVVGTNGVETVNIAPGVDIIFNVVYNDDNHDEDNVAYVTASLWDAHRREEIDFDCTGDFTLNDDGEFVYPDRALKSQQELSDHIIDKNVPEINDVTNSYLKSIQAPEDPGM